MAFDPSVISQIADYAPNPVKAKGDAYTLANMADTNTLNKMKLSDIKQKQEEEEKYKQILKGRDWSTDKGATETAAAITQAGLPERAMQFMKERQDIQSGALDIQMKRLAVAENQQSALMGAMDYVHRTVDEYKTSNPKATPAEVDAKNQELVTAAMDQLSKDRPDLIPAIDQYKREPGALTYNGVVTHMAKGKEGLARLKEYIAEQKGEREEKRVDIAQQQANTQAENAVTAQKRMEAYTENVESLKKLRDPGLLPDKVMAIAVPSVMADKNSMSQFVSAGPSSAKQRNQINAAITARLDAAGLTPEDLPRIRANTKAEATSINKLIPQLNAVTAYEKLGKFNGEKLLDLIDQLDDTGIPLVEGPLRWAKKNVAGSTDAKLFGSVLTAYQTEAARILNNPNMTGVLHRSSIDDMQHIISADVTAEQAKVLVNRINLEMDFRARSLQESINEAGQAMKMPGATAQPGVAAQTPGDAPPDASAGGPPSAAAPLAAQPPTVPQWNPSQPGVGFWKKH